MAGRYSHNQPSFPAETMAPPAPRAAVPSRVNTLQPVRPSSAGGPSPLWKYVFVCWVFITYVCLLCSRICFSVWFVKWNAGYVWFLFFIIIVIPSLHVYVSFKVLFKGRREPNPMRNVYHGHLRCQGQCEEACVTITLGHGLGQWLPTQAQPTQTRLQ